MRTALVISTVVSVVLLSLPAAKPSVADEIFLCEDGRTLQINASNREKLSKDPCVQAWFQGNQTLAQKKAAEEKHNAEKGPQTMVGMPPEAPMPGLPFFFGRR